MKKLLFYSIILVLLGNGACQKKNEILGGIPFQLEKDSMYFDANGGVDSARISDWGVWIDSYNVFTPHDTIDIYDLRILPGNELETRWFTIDHQRALLKVQVYPTGSIDPRIYSICVSSGNSCKVLKIFQDGKQE